MFTQPIKLVDNKRISISISQFIQFTDLQTAASYIIIYQSNRLPILWQLSAPGRLQQRKIQKKKKNTALHSCRIIPTINAFLMRLQLQNSSKISINSWTYFYIISTGRHMYVSYIHPSIQLSISFCAAPPLTSCIACLFLGISSSSLANYNATTTTTS